MSDEIIRKPDPELTAKSSLERFTVDEQVAYDKFLRSGKARVSVDFNKRLYELYLRGLGCDAIAVLNPGLSLGMVCCARVDGRWDERRDQYTAELLSETNGLLRQTAAEALQFLSLVLAVAHREHGEKLKKYLASGNPDDLGDFRIESFGNYKSVIETVAKLVGADQSRTVTHRMVGGAEQKMEDVGIVGALSGRLTPKQAELMRAAMEKGRE
jgi:hypothetical protein